MRCYVIKVCAIPEETCAIRGYGPKSGITDELFCSCASDNLLTVFCGMVFPHNALCRVNTLILWISAMYHDGHSLQVMVSMVGVLSLIYTHIRKMGFYLDSLRCPYIYLDTIQVNPRKIQGPVKVWYSLEIPLKYFCPRTF